MDIHSTLQQLEESLLTDVVRKDPDRLSSLLAEDFREFGSSGRCFTKTEILHLLQDEPAASLTLKAFKASPLCEHTVLVTYRAVKGVLGGPSIESLRSSIWVFREARWQMLFHQGTKISTE